MNNTLATALEENLTQGLGDHSRKLKPIELGLVCTQLAYSRETMAFYSGTYSRGHGGTFFSNFSRCVDCIFFHCCDCSVRTQGRNDCIQLADEVTCLSKAGPTKADQRTTWGLLVAPQRQLHSAQQFNKKCKANSAAKAPPGPSGCLALPSGSPACTQHPTPTGAPVDGDSTTQSA